MQEFWRHPALPIGIVLVVLGLGNWLVSHDKVVDYARRASAPAPLAWPDALSDFKRLTPRTNATLLERLHRGLGDYGFADAKRDFYIVVQSGGRFIAATGFLLIGWGLVGRWRVRRTRRPSARRALGAGAGRPSARGA